MRRWTGALLVLVTSLASAQPRTDEPFTSPDPMELARAVDRLGDDAVLARLAASQPRAARLAAVQAAPFLREPELALPALAELAAGRDPRLAPAAAASILAITRALDADALTRRESDPRALAPVRARLSALHADASARPDLRAAAAVAEAGLEAMGVP